jgi:hypothetical protein
MRVDHLTYHVSGFGKVKRWVLGFRGTCGGTVANICSRPYLSVVGVYNGKGVKIICTMLIQKTKEALKKQLEPI